MNLKTLYFLETCYGFVLQCVLCCVMYLQCRMVLDFSVHDDIAEASTVPSQEASVNYGKSGLSDKQDSL